jgi:sortase A
MVNFPVRRSPDGAPDFFCWFFEFDSMGSGVMRRTTRAIALMFEFVGAVILGYTVFLLARAQVFQTYSKWAFNQFLQSSQSGVQRSSGSQPIFPRASAHPAPPLESLIGQIEIPRLHLTTMIVEGDDEPELSVGAGHLPGSALPGEAGNVVIAAHRDTFFRPLRKISKNDRIVLTTISGSFPYRVDSVQITGPDDVGVLRASNEPTLTLVTCYPFSFVGPAPSRFIVHARKIE